MADWIAPGAPLRHLAQLTAWLAILIVLFVPLERLFALHRAPLWRRQTGIDLAYYFLNNLLPTVLLAPPVALLAWALHTIIPATWLNWSATLPLWARLSLALLVTEVGGYWGHRWSHQIPLLWRFHAVHHSAEELDWLVNTRAHPVDIAFGRLCALVPLYALGLIAPTPGGTALALTVTFVSTFYGFFVHINARWRFGPLEHLLATPAFHHWHHVRDSHTNRNYAAMLPWLDRLFGTFHLPPHHWPAAYGIDTPIAATLIGQLVDPLLHPRRLLTDAAPPPQGAIVSEHAASEQA